MKTLTFAVMLAASALAHADMPGVKAGLWQTKLIHQIVDGKDMAAQIAATQAKMQAMMANMTPEQRAQMGPMLKNMPDQNGNMRVCFSAAMAAKQTAMIDPQGHCTASSSTPVGNKVSFSFTCNQNGTTSTGTGERVLNGNVVTTHLDITSTDAKGQHKVQMDTEMTYLGSDCQGVTPMDELIKSMPGQHP